MGDTPVKKATGRELHGWFALLDEWKTPSPLGVGSRLAFAAEFLGRRLSYVYEVAEYLPGERLVMRTDQGPFR